MSDIIDRIAEARNTIELEHAAADAIDEIKQLRKDVVHWREARRTCIEAGDIMKTEIERLGFELKSWKESYRTLLEETERLRWLLREWLDDCDDQFERARDLEERTKEALGDESNPSSR